MPDSSLLVTLAPRRVTHAVLGVVATAVVAGILGMHALVASGSVGTPDPAEPGGGATSGELGHLGDVAAAASSAWHAADGDLRHAGHGFGGSGHGPTGACLALLAGLVLWLFAPARRAGLPGSLPGPDVLAALAAALSARSRPPGPPDLHALSILRC